MLELNQTVAHEAQQETSEDHQIVVETNGGEILPEDQSRLPGSEWIIPIYENLKQAGLDNEARPWEKRSIFQIPHYLKDGKEEAYVPKIVCLGPYHHDNENLRKMDQHKWRCLERILKRNNKKIEDYLDAIKEVEEEAHAYYQETITMSSNEFLEMMVLDGCFVIELFRGFFHGFDKLDYTHFDPIFSSLWSSNDLIRRDMILLENQIPLLILNRLFDLQPFPLNQGTLAELALYFFNPLMPTGYHDLFLNREQLRKRAKICSEWLQSSLQHWCREPPVHCLELFRRSLLLGSEQAPTETRASSQIELQFIHCVMELRKKRIKFKMGERGGFRNIHFKDGTLVIPQLVIYGGTRSLFLNLIAFEQRYFNCGKDITSYLFFMDNLINSTEDVGHLHDCGIMEHWLGSDAEVVDLFNELPKEVVLVGSHCYLAKLSKDVNTYSSNKWNVKIAKWNGWIAGLKLKYFSSPWSIISLIAAFILLVLTLTQTLYAVFSYYKPSF